MQIVPAHLIAWAQGGQSDQYYISVEIENKNKPMNGAQLKSTKQLWRWVKRRFGVQPKLATGYIGPHGAGVSAEAAKRDYDPITSAICGDDVTTNAGTAAGSARTVLPLLASSSEALPRGWDAGAAGGDREELAHVPLEIKSNRWPLVRTKTGTQCFGQELDARFRGDNQTIRSQCIAEPKAASTWKCHRDSSPLLDDPRGTFLEIEMSRGKPDDYIRLSAEWLNCHMLRNIMLSGGAS